MPYLPAIFLGLVQGAAEFLPVSSSAHLILAPWLFGFPDPGLAFDVALHSGTLVAVILHFYKDWINIFRLALKNFKSNPNDKISNFENTQYERNMFWLLILATIPGVLAGYFLESYAESLFRSPVLVATTLSAVGLILYLVDKYHTHRKNLRQISWRDSLLIGLSQAAAVIPGVSRSGATITAGLAMGLNRQSAARFSFLLSMPIILGATVKQFPDFWQSGINLPLFLAVAASAISGYLAIKYLLRFIERASYAIFFWYRLALAAVVLAVYFSRI